MENGYGYSGKLESILSQYTFHGTYLDNAAAPLVAQCVAFKAAEYIASNQLVNPHSKTYWSEKTGVMVQETRKRVLSMLGVLSPDEYDLVFTANATASLKLIGECMASYRFVYHTDSHTSVVGLRALAESYKTSLDIGSESVDESTIVCWPLQSNFDGTRYPASASWIRDIRAQSAISVLDLSAYCSTSMPTELEEWPDLAVLSFYKIFGMPDLGALVVRKSERIHKFLRLRAYAGGGTVSALTPNLNFMVKSDDTCTSLEDGTLPFHSIGMLSCAITEFEHLYGSFSAISAHTRALHCYCFSKLQQTGLCTILSPRPDPDSDLVVGPIITFNLKGAGYHEFSNVCNKLDIHVRTGTLCNVGAFTLKSQIKDADLIYNHKVLGKTCSDDQEFLNGKETGVIRISLGPYSTREDVDRLIDCITTYFGDLAEQEVPAPQIEAAEIKELVVYPIKSCAGILLNECVVSDKGLEWDREYCLVNPSSKTVYSLKTNLCMAKIHARPTQNVLEVEHMGKKITVPRDPSKWPGTPEPDVSICGARTSDLILNNDPRVVAFFSQILQKPCTLARQTDQEARHSRHASADANIPLSLSNSSPILLISKTSARSLDNADHHVFRANVIVETSEPWQEDSWRQIRINDGKYDTLGPCRRCNMVCVTRDGESNAGPYLSLTKTRRFGGKLWFGQHMQTHGLEKGAHFKLSVGDRVQCVATKPVEFA